MLGSIVRMATDLEKRLRLLRQQVYGRDNVSSSISQAQQGTDEIAYLYHDLVKISLLASMAIGIQLILFVLNFF